MSADESVRHCDYGYPPDECDHELCLTGSTRIAKLESTIASQQKQIEELRAERCCDHECEPRPYCFKCGVFGHKHCCGPCQIGKCKEHGNDSRISELTKGKT